jgi:hypothetical protein
MTASSRFAVPWYLLLLSGLVFLGSAVVGVSVIGDGLMRLPYAIAVAAYALPILFYLLSIAGTWEQTRSERATAQSRGQRAAVVAAAILFTLGALVMPLRMGHWDVLAMLMTGFISAAGPITLSLILPSVSASASQ